MEIRDEPRGGRCEAFREALARDKTRTQVFPISELGLVEMTRKRVSEGLVEAFSETCPTCAGRGFVVDESLLDRCSRLSRFRPRYPSGSRGRHVRSDPHRRQAVPGRAEASGSTSSGSAPRPSEVELAARARSSTATGCSPRPQPARRRLGDAPGSSARPRARRSAASPTRTSRTSGAAGVTASTTRRSRSPRSRRAERRTHMSKKKGAASSRNGRDSNAQRLGRQGLQRRGRDRGDDHRAPARHALPPG